MKNAARVRTESQKEAQRAACRRWRERHPDRARAATARWLAEHPGYALEWARANRDKCQARAARYYTKHHDRELARGVKRYTENPERERERVREYRTKHRERSKANEAASHRRRQYGLSPETFEALMAEHEGRCAICARDFTEKLRPCVDHDHATGVVRGLLCRHCNLGLGYYEQHSFAAMAGAYLERHARKLQTAAA